MFCNVWGIFLKFGKKKRLTRNLWKYCLENVTQLTNDSLPIDNEKNISPPPKKAWLVTFQSGQFETPQI